jgi:PAS domain S-box-containing protein
MGGEEAAQLAAFIRNVPGAIYRCRIDEHWTMQFISDGIERLSGYRPSELIGNEQRSFSSIIHADDRQLVQSVVAAAVAERKPFAPEYRIVRADGAVVWVLERGQAVSDPDGREWLDGVIFDITHRKVLEEELQRAVALEVLADERLRVARELHDVVGHAVSMAAVQAGAARAVLRRDADAASQALESVEGCLREALVEMRQMVTGLHGPASAGRPGIARLESLVDRVSGAGLRVRFSARGTERDLPAAVDVTLYRVVQESLTNCLKYASGAEVEVIVTQEPGRVRLEVADDGTGCVTEAGIGGSAGWGLEGLRERAVALGGALSAGPRPGGGFEVAAWFPVRT